MTVTTDSLLREAAAYGDLTYRFSPSFDVQGGIRYSHIAQDYEQTDFTFAGAPLVPDLAGSATLSKNTYLGVARYHLDQDTMLYARVATGYRPGGPNDVIPGVSSAAATYQSDSLISYEVGLKGALAAGSVRLFDRRLSNQLEEYSSSGRGSQHQPSCFTTTEGRRTVKGSNSNSATTR